MIDVIIKKEFKDLIPPLKQEEYDLLEQSLLEEGCRESLIHWSGILVDGHNRREICKKHKIPYFLSEIEFESNDEAKLWIIKNQLGRRNISSSFVRVELALKMELLLKEKAKKNMLGGSPILAEGHLDVREEIAKEAKISHGTI